MKDAFVYFMLFLLATDFCLRIYSARSHVIHTGELVALTINGAAIVFGLTAVLA